MVTLSHTPGLRALARPEHPVSRRNIDRNAIKVLYRLDRAGYRAFLVGGSVRDLMLRRRPKDFDVVTDARPNQIRRLFRNSRLIGRRFRLAHIMFRESVIEVSTFRRDPDPEDQKRNKGELLVTSDNTFGTPCEDAFRRDFTVNALFYDIADFSVIDYVGGIEDLRQGVIRVIGDPDLRFREDPVRMLRACEFAGRLRFTIDPRTQEAIWRHRDQIEKASPARMAEELVQLLRCGAAGPAMQWLLELGLLEIFLPEACAAIEAAERGLGDLPRILPAVDRMIRDRREIPDTALLAAFLVPRIELLRSSAGVRGDVRPSTAVTPGMVHETLAPFFRRFPISNLKERRICQALETLQRLRPFPANRSLQLKLTSRPSFSDALLVLEILVAAMGEGGDALDAWRSSLQGRRRGSKAGGGRRRRPRRRRPSPPS